MKMNSALAWPIPVILASSSLTFAIPQEPTQDSETEETESWIDKFIDDEDGMLDISEYLENPGSFILVPIPITEPSVGYGLGLAGVFLQPRKEFGDKGFKRPNITGVGGMKTDNGTNALGLFDMRYWGDGSFRTRAFGLTSSVNMDFHVPSTSADFRYNLAVDGAQLAGEWATPIEHFSWEVNYSYFEIDARFDSVGPLPISLPNRDKSTISSAGATLKYDSRDNIFSPQAGLLSQTSVTINDDVLGATDDFQKLKQTVINYWPVCDKWTAGLRVEGEAVFGDFPFYVKPYIGLRGVPVMRYQGEITAVGELELQYAVSERFRLLGFAGTGRTWDEINSQHVDQSTVSGGVGLRYRIARKFGLDFGIDYAVSDDDQAIYFQFGSAWLRP